MNNSRFVRATALLPLTALSATLFLSACGGAETQLRDGLVSAGLSVSTATCMAKPMAERLSLGQLMKLRSLSKVSKLDLRKTSYDKLMHQIRALNDPEILKVTTSAALSCTFGI